MNFSKNLQWRRLSQGASGGGHTQMSGVTDTLSLNLYNFRLILIQQQFFTNIQSQKWRERWGVDDIANWKVPQPLNDYTPHGLCGFDKDGCPIILIPFAGMDMWGMLHTVSRADFIRATIQNLENYMRIGYEQSKTHGPKARQFVILFDMQGFHLKQYTWRPGN